MTFVEELERAREESVPEGTGFRGWSRELILANIYNLIGPPSMKEAEAIVRGVHFHQTRAVIEGRHGSFLLKRADVTGLSDNGSAVGRIFVSYHYGPYRLVSGVLLAAGRPLTIVIDDAVARRQGETMQSLLSAGLTDMGLANAPFSFRDTSDPALLLHLARDLKSGRDVLLYIDGNTGAQGRGAARERQETVAFMGQRLRARAGIALLARLAHAEITPVIARRVGDTDLQTSFTFLESLSFDMPCNELVQKMWTPLEESVRADPCEWESIRYVHEFLERPCKPPASQAAAAGGAGSRIALDDLRFGIWNGSKGLALFDRRSYRMHAVTGRLAEIVRTCTAPVTRAMLVETGATPDDLEWLSDTGIIRSIH